ncbi:MAG: flagellar biosynthetic protein FliR [Burkholderiaceae bacterium]|nr:flagellar biosynthetic protein FliR [Burkholderiaceae bacterium]
MVNFNSAELNAWMVALLWPATRLLAVISVTPIFGHASVPVRVKVGLGLLLAMAIAPGLPPLPEVAPFSGDGIMILLQQMLIGLCIGLSMRLVFAAVEMAGELMALTMGLSFAAFFDPLSRSHASPVSQMFSWLALMVFVSSNLHLALLAAVADSFHALPISALPMGTGLFRMVAATGGKVFAIGLQLALPVIAALLVTNLALGILTKAAPQLNLFGIGFPITLAAGFLMIGLVLPYLTQPLLRAMEDALAGLAQMVR